LRFQFAGSEIHLTLLEQSVIESSVKLSELERRIEEVEARTLLCEGESVPGSKRNCRKRIYAVSVLICLLSSLAWSQGEAVHIGAVLKDEIVSPAVADFQMRQHIVQATAPLPKPPATPAEWTASADRLRRHLLDDVVFHGWPKQWVDSPPKFEEQGVIETGRGYRIRKLRFEFVPGFYSSALLYEPEHMDATVPAILNMSGHDGPLGYSYEFKQKRCISFAKHGILALNLEWFGFGELSKEGNDHSFAAHLDLAGANGVGVFYLEMRRGLDYLYFHPHVDRKRIGVTGLSGGGWQTIVLSSLDERVKASNPVAGFAATSSRVEAKEFGDMGDIEQSATDFLRGSDYPYLVALMAPRPILLTYNGEDDCCFRASLVKPRVFDAIQPFFGLYGKADNLNWHENRDPGDHNYQLDNRLTAYSFFTKQFGLPPISDEAGAAAELRSYAELVTALPEDNLTILGLARQLGRQISRSPIPTAASERAAWASSERGKLREIVRYQPVELQDTWATAMTKSRDVQSISYLFQLNNGLSVNGIWLRSILQSSDTAPVSIVLHDDGRSASADLVAQRFSRGDQVLALDLMFTGSAWKGKDTFEFAQMLGGLGERPLGLQAAQLIRIARWAEQKSGTAKVRLDVSGMRNQAVALVAAALEPDLFSEITVWDGIRSFSYVLEKPVTYAQAPELFCLDLYKEFDVDRLEVLAAPVAVQSRQSREVPASRP
jgi:dienelactone hydrolase